MNHIPLHHSVVLGLGVTFGNLAIWLGLASAVAASVFYWLSMLRRMRTAQAPVEQPAGRGARRAAGAAAQTELSAAGFEQLGRRFFIVSSACFAVAAIALWTLIFAREIVVMYVHKNASDDLTLAYRFATFWADQGGTFILWGLYNTVLGALLLRKAKPDAPWVMPFFSLMNISLFTLLCFMNPFWLASPDTIRKILAELGATPEITSFLPSNFWQHLVYYFGWAGYPMPSQGPGLNESLRNFWMVIHPPTLFVGYSSTVVASCFALGALMHRDYDGWVNRAAPWLTFSWGILGVGIFLGAYWAYETLGWGGYWMWDPVENSSIIPWVVGGALIHGLLAQRARGNFKQANLFLGGLLGTSILLSSFLVRSGVLDGASVHSFATPQKSVFYTLLAMLLVWSLLHLAIWVWRFRDIQSEIAYERVWERHFGFFLGVITLAASAFVIAFGVTVPIWKPWMPGTQSLQIEHVFYNKALLPVYFTVVLLMAITPLAPWRQRSEKKRLKPFTLASLGLGALLLLAFLASGVYAWSGGFQTRNDPAYIIFGLALLLGLITNGVVLARTARAGLLQTGPWMAHIGFFLMLAGVLVTTRFKLEHQVQPSELGQSVAVFGRSFTYRGQKEKQPGKVGDKDRMLIDMTVNGKTRRLDPPLFIIKAADGSKSLMAWPAIINEWVGGAWGDVYVVPSGVDLGNYNFLEVQKEKPAGALVRYRHDSPQDEVALVFKGLDTTELQKLIQTSEGETGPASVTLRAEVDLIINGQVQQLRPAVRYDLQNQTKEPVPLPVQGLNQPVGYRLEFVDTNLDPKDLKASFQLTPDTLLERGTFQVLVVPGIQVLWLGCYLMFFGAFLTWRRRSQLAGQPVSYDVRRDAPAVESAPAEKKKRPRAAG